MATREVSHESAGADDRLADGMLGMKESMAFTGLQKDMLYKAMATGELPSFKFGKRRLIAKRDLVKWLERRLVPQS